VPRVRFGNLGLGFAMPSGLKRYYGQADLHLLPSVVTGGCGVKTVRARELFVQGLGKSARRWDFAWSQGVPPAVCVRASGALVPGCHVTQRLRARANVWRTSGALYYRGCGGERSKIH